MFDMSLKFSTENINLKLCIQRRMDDKIGMGERVRSSIWGKVF